MNGMFWTTDIEFAKLFKEQNADGVIYQVEALKDDILGIFETGAKIIGTEEIQNGLEYVLDIWKLDNLIEEFESPL